MTSDMKDFFDSLYTRFLLRDLFAKVVPGGLLLATIVYTSKLDRYFLSLSERFDWLLSVGAFGLSWVVGFGVQSIGESVRWIQHHPAEFDNQSKRYNLRCKFSRLATDIERQQVERYAVIKEACGNAAMAVLLSLGVVAIETIAGELRLDPGAILTISFLLTISAYLLKANYSHAEKHYTFMKKLVGGPQNVKAIAFDFDGVIADSMPSQEKTWIRAISSVSDDPVALEGIKRNFWDGKAREQIFDGVDLTEQQRAEARQEKNALWLPQRSEVALPGGAANVLQELSEKYSLFVATTADRAYVEAILARETLQSCFAEILTDAEVSAPKPAPEMILEIAEKALCSPREVLVVGDSRVDQQMANAAGALFVAMDLHDRWRQDGRSYRVGSWLELLTLLEWGGKPDKVSIHS